MNEIRKIFEAFELPLDEEVERVYLESETRGNRELLKSKTIEAEYYPAIPPNFLPLLHGTMGDSFGLYFHRSNRGRSFSAIVSLNETSFVGCLGAAPEWAVFEERYWEEDNEKYGDDFSPATSPDWSEMRIDFDSGVIRFDDLLRPFALNGDAKPFSGFGPVSFKDLRLEFAGSVSESIFIKSADVGRVSCWKEFSKALHKEGDSLGALYALENALALLWERPSGYIKTGRFFAARELWNEMAELDVGDTFTRKVIDIQCRNADKFVEDEANFQ